MPFAGFKDFADCVAKNQDKESPEGFCAFLHKQVTGKFPAEASSEAIAAAEAMSSMASLDETILGLEILKVGSFKDSLGIERSFDETDLSSIVSAFRNNAPKVVPIKLGHTSDSFNKQVAQKLDIPEELVVGEGFSQRGAARLGKVVGLRTDGKTLFADIAVHDKVARLIREGFFDNLSSEIQFNRQRGDNIFPIALSGLALLGAQRPAIEDTSTLRQLTMSEEGEYADSQICCSLTTVEVPTPYKLLSMSLLAEGVTQVPASDANGGGDVLWEVPITDLSKGGFVQATVSAPNEASAKRVALRVAENFLLNATGPLGKILGGTVGFLLARRLVVGAPKKVTSGVLGRLFWRFGEATSEKVGTVATYVVGPLSATDEGQFGIVGTLTTVGTVASAGLVASMGLTALATAVQRRGLEITDSDRELLSEIEDIADELARNRFRQSGEKSAALRELRDKVNRLGSQELKDFTKRDLAVDFGVKLEDNWVDTLDVTRMPLATFEEAVPELEGRVFDKPIDAARAILSWVERNRQPIKVTLEWVELGITIVGIIGALASLESLVKFVTKVRREGDGQLRIRGAKIVEGAVSSINSEGDSEGNSEGVSEMDKEVFKLLGLAEQAAEQEVIQAVQALKDKSESKGVEQASFEEMKRSLEEVKQQNMVLRFQEQTTDLQFVPGTAKELATKLASIAMKFGEEEAESLLQQWKQLNAQAEQLGLNSALLASGPEAAAPSFEQAVAAYAEEHQVSKGEAAKVLMRQNPSGYREYAKGRQIR